MDMKKSDNLAVLIDADNASSQTIKAILEETTKFGEAIVKRIYGNFVLENQANERWKDAVNELGIKTMQQFAFTTGKNATDGFMMIDAMDLLYTNRFDGFCIVSSDSDFTALAIRLKEQGVKVYGFGRKQTPLAFINACSQFIYVENLIKEQPENNPQENPIQEYTHVQKTITKNDVKKDNRPQQHDLPLDILRKIFEQSDDEWVALGGLGSQWKLLQVDFDPRNYGCAKLTDLIRKYSDIFEYEMRKNSSGTHENMYAKLRI